jgi:hypothetical protein
MNDLFSVLAHNGFATARELGLALSVSQPTVSRLLNASQASNAHIARFGQGRSTVYALYESVLGLPPQLVLYWVDAQGHSTQIAQVHHLSGGRLFVEPVDAPPQRFEPAVGRALPWWLSSLLLQGYLGKLRHAELSAAQPMLPALLDQWSSTHHLYAHAHGQVDGRGALLVNAAQVQLWHQMGLVEGVRNEQVAQHYDALANHQVQQGSPGGSSADGEQAKFIVRRQAVQSVTEVIVKFSPPRDTPFGQRWHELLWTEQIAHEVLRAAGVDVPHSRIVSTPQRTYFESERIDRVGRAGRRHMIPLAVVHHAFVPGSYQHWSATLKMLATQQRVDAAVLQQVETLRAFGHLIGNTDMHGGNYSLIVPTPADLWRGRFVPAPVYDMLCMRWAPSLGVAPDYAWFDAAALLAPLAPDAVAKGKALALHFWERAREIPQASKALLQVREAALAYLH